MKRIAGRLSIPALFIMIFSGCYNDKSELLYPATATCKTDSVTYSGTVKSIVELNCAFSGCHNSASAMAGVKLDNIAGVQAVAGNGDLLGVINHAAGFSAMPKDRPKLDACSIQKISKWVQDGAPSN